MSIADPFDTRPVVPEGEDRLAPRSGEPHRACHVGRSDPGAAPENPTSLEELLERYSAADDAIARQSAYVRASLGDSAEVRRLTVPPPVTLEEAPNPRFVPHGREVDPVRRELADALEAIKEAARTRALVAGLMLRTGLAPGRWHVLGDEALYLDLDAACAERWRLYHLPTSFVYDAPVGEHPSVTERQHELRSLARGRAWRPAALFVAAAAPALAATVASGGWKVLWAVPSLALFAAAAASLLGALRLLRLAAEIRYEDVACHFDGARSQAPDDAGRPGRTS